MEIKEFVRDFTVGEDCEVILYKVALGSADACTWDKVWHGTREEIINGNCPYEEFVAVTGVSLQDITCEHLDSIGLVVEIKK